MKKHFSTILILFLAIFMTSSCISKKEMEALRMENSKLKALNEDTRVKLAECNATTRNLQDRVASEKQRAANERQRVADLRADYLKLQGSLDKSLQQNSQTGINISKLVDEINASNRFIKQLVEAKTKSDSLNIALTNKLTRSLNNSELQEVDVKVLKGVVYISLADNMLYKSGSYEINERAGETLSKIAKIIKDYREYDVLVEGNTDPIPIKRTNIRNNWDLSCLRASSVVQALQNNYGVDPKRLSAAGRGEYNPLTTNDTELGKQRNRRTQIIITPKLDQFMDLIDKAPETKGESQQ